VVYAKTANIRVILTTRHYALSHPNARQKSTAITLTSIEPAASTTIYVKMNEHTIIQHAIMAIDLMNV
jgi:hypothetical protein